VDGVRERRKTTDEGGDQHVTGVQNRRSSGFIIQTYTSLFLLAHRNAEGFAQVNFHEKVTTLADACIFRCTKLWLGNVAAKLTATQFQNCWLKGMVMP
jgi:hypothetical protein